MESKISEKDVRKEKVSSAEIIVTGTADKPYYEIKYYDLSDRKYHIGYSSYDLGNVFGWLKECFEIVEEPHEMMSDKEFAEYVKKNNFFTTADKKPKIGEWIPCSEQLPSERDWYLAVFREIDTGFQLIPRVADNIGFVKEDTTSDGWQFVDGDHIPTEYLHNLKCVAWQRLPEPYKP